MDQVQVHTLYSNATKALEKSKEVLKEIERKYPDNHEDIKRLRDKIAHIEQKYQWLDKTKKVEPFDWGTIQTNYEKYCRTFSPAYLSGCEWYRIIGDDFKVGYLNWKLAELYSPSASHRNEKIFLFLYLSTLV